MPNITLTPQTLNELTFNDLDEFDIHTSNCKLFKEQKVSSLQFVIHTSNCKLFKEQKVSSLEEYIGFKPTRGSRFI